MDIPQVLAVLRPEEDWGPCAQTESTYADLARTWRSPESECPTEAEMLACWEQLETGREAERQRALRAATVRSLMSATDPVSVGVRAFVRDLYTRHNDLRELLGLPRETEPEIMARVIAGIGDGLGEPAEQPAP